jgi:hypothetical protein
VIRGIHVAALYATIREVVHHVPPALASAWLLFAAAATAQPAEYGASTGKNTPDQTFGGKVFSPKQNRPRGSSNENSD